MADRSPQAPCESQAEDEEAEDNIPLGGFMHIQVLEE